MYRALARRTDTGGADGGGAAAASAYASAVRKESVTRGPFPAVAILRKPPHFATVGAEDNPLPGAMVPSVPWRPAPPTEIPGVGQMHFLMAAAGDGVIGPGFFLLFGFVLIGDWLGRGSAGRGPW